MSGRKRMMDYMTSGDSTGLNMSARGYTLMQFKAAGTVYDVAIPSTDYFVHVQKAAGARVIYSAAESFKFPLSKGDTICVFRTEKEAIDKALSEPELSGVVLRG